MEHSRSIHAAIVGALALTAAVAAFASLASAAVAAPSVTLTSSANPSTYGQKIVLTATVTDPEQPASQISGTMTYADEEAWLGTAEVRNGTASLSNSAIDAGNDPITAIFTPAGGGAKVASAPFPQVVNPADTTIALVSSRPSAEYGQGGKVTATVKPVAPATAKPTGSVDYEIDGGYFWTAPLNTAAKATLSLAEMYPSFYPGTYSITASYSGDENYNPSTTTSPIAQKIVGITSEPISTISLNEKGQPVFSPSSFKLSSATPIGCNVTITNSTAEGFAMLYGTPGNWKRLPGGGIGAGASRGVGVGLAHFTGYFTVLGAANYVAIHCK
jgi:Bacterial Ig-like domain (group 3)